MPNNNILKALINICLILLTLYSVTAYSLFVVTHYSYLIPSTNILLNIYIEQQYNASPLKINLSFSNFYIIFYIFNTSKMSISYSSQFNSSSNMPIIFYNESINATIIKVKYIFASNMTIVLSTPFQFVKIVGNTSIENISISFMSYFTSSNSSKLYWFNYNYIIILVIFIISILSFIILRRYKGYK